MKRLNELNHNENVRLLNRNDTIENGIEKNAVNHTRTYNRNRRTERYNTRLIDSAREVDLEKCAKSLKDGAVINSVCRTLGVTALMVATSWGFEKMVAYLLEKGADPTIMDKEGRTSVHLAVVRGNANCLKALLENELGKTLLNAKIEKPEMEDSKTEDKSIDSWLHKHDTLMPFEIPKLEPGTTPLHTASQYSYFDCVKLLIEKGADLGECDYRGLTPLDVAGEVKYFKGDPISIEIHDENLDCLPTRPSASSAMGCGAEFADSESDYEGDEKIQTTSEIIKEIWSKHKPNKASMDLNSETNLINSLKPKSTANDVGNISKQLKTFLHTAMQNEDFLAIKLTASLNLKDYISQPDENGYTPLHLAVEKENIKILSYVFSLIPEAINVRNSKGESLLFKAVESDWLFGVDYLLNTNVDIKLKSNDEISVIHVAAKKSDSTLLEELLTYDDAKNMIDDLDKNGKTALSYAVENASFNCTKCLLMNKCCPTLVQNGEITLLHISARNGSDSILKLLLNSEAKFLMAHKSLSSNGGMTPIHEASKEGHVACVKLLLDHDREKIIYKLKTKYSPYYGSTVLHLASRNGHLDVIKLLINFDKNLLNENNQVGWYPIHVAARFRHAECLRYLLNNGADISSQVTLSKNIRKTALDFIMNYIPQPIDFLKDIFDSFIITNKRPLMHESCEVVFNYDFLTPPVLKDEHQLAVLDAIVNSSKLNLQDVLLSHPLAETFIFLKWKKLRGFFFVIFFLYILLTASITYKNLSLCTNVFSSNWMLNSVCSSLIGFVLPILVTLELFQVCRLKRYYLYDIESFIKWSIFILATYIEVSPIYLIEASEQCLNVSSIIVLLLWFEILMLFSRLPNWGYYVLMFCKVALNVVKVLATFSIMLIGFMLALIIQFKSTAPFKSVFESFIKIILMTSEIEYGDMFNEPVDISLQWSVVARLILLAFVILITIVLTNLMMGIAVNDIAMLEAQGRTHRLAKQVMFLSLIEALINNSKIFKTLLKPKISNKLPMQLILRTGKPNSREMKIFPHSLITSILDKLSKLKNVQSTIDENDVSKSRMNLKCGSTSSVSTIDTMEHRYAIMSAMERIVNDLHEMKTELNELKYECQFSRRRV